MQSPAESARQPEPQSPGAVSSHHGDPLEHGIISTHGSTEDPPTTAQAVLRILTAVENISSKYDEESCSSSSDASSEGEGHQPHDSAGDTIVDRDRPHIERLPMSLWNPHALLSSKPYRKGHIIATAFYTEVPGPVMEAESSLSDADFKAAYSKDKWSSGPQRILVHTKGLVNEIRQITHVPDAQRTGVLTMVPPFKHLIHHRQAIKSRLDELKQAASSREHTGDNSTETSNEESMRLIYLQGIHDFIQTDLANYIGLELKIRDGDIEEVLFEELYHLFRPGDLALAAETGESQVYKVSSVTGGRKLLSARSELPGTPMHLRGMDLRAGTWMDLQIVCFSMGWDGENIGPRQTHYNIAYFGGRRLVTDLDLYPIQFHDDCDGVRKRLCARGLKLVQCDGHKKYSGTSVPPHKSLNLFLDRRLGPPPGAGVGGGIGLADDEEVKTNPFEMVRSDVYIDYKALYVNYFSTLPMLGMVPRIPGEDAEAIDTLSDGRFWNCSDRDMDSLQSEKFHNTHRHLTKFGRPKGMAHDEDRLLLLPGQVPAFLFSSRKWEWLDLDNIEDIDKSEPSRNSGWKELVIPHKFSDLLLSLVSNHISDVSVRQWEASARHDSTVQIDLVRGKGMGLIILLHGPPGSGKTSTAETIAAYTGRPLYAITCGDLGTAPKELEKNLVRHTRLAEQWGCVLLLDEADVFLMSRNYHDMHRNAMVSIFLRQLEYYSGILFLTTNIVGVIDEAFKSRIHVALEYPAINENSTIEIWSKILQRIKRDNEKAEIKIIFNETNLKKFAKSHYRRNRRSGTTWNGRQIRNAFQTAIGIGQYERLKKVDEAIKEGRPPERSSRSIRLTVASFQAVAETTSDFEKYITRTRGDDRERAAAHEFRHDEHSREPPPRKGYRTAVSTYHTDQDIGVSRAGRSRRYAGGSTSPGRRRTTKGKEVHRKGPRVTRSISDSEEHTEQGSAKYQDSEVGSDEDIIEQDFEDEDE